MRLSHQNHVSRARERNSWTAHSASISLCQEYIQYISHTARNTREIFPQNGWKRFFACQDKLLFAKPLERNIIWNILKFCTTTGSFSVLATIFIAKWQEPRGLKRQRTSQDWRGKCSFIKIYEVIWTIKEENAWIIAFCNTFRSCRRFAGSLHLGKCVFQVFFCFNVSLLSSQF